MTPSEKVKALRTHLGLSQQKFADTLGVHRSYLNDIERGKDPSMNFAKALKDVYNISIDWLISGEEQPEASEKNTGLNPKEQAILELYHALTPEQQQQIYTAIEDKKRLNELEQQVKDILKNAG